MFFTSTLAHVNTLNSFLFFCAFVFRYSDLKAKRPTHRHPLHYKIHVPLTVKLIRPLLDKLVRIYFIVS